MTVTAHVLHQPNHDSARHDDLAWRAALHHVVLQEPLIDSRASVRALEQLELKQAPSTVFVGIGLCTRTEVSVALPVDLLGILLPAERVRRALDAERLVVLVADTHAEGNGFHPERVDEAARRTEALLQRLARRLGLERMEVVRASSFHRTPGYRRVLAEVDLRAPHEDGHYFRRQVADLEYMHRRYGGVIKVGWVVSGSSRVQRRRDELAFDERFQSWLGRHVAFIYCKAGRTLDDRRPKASPYVVLDPSRRLCLLPDEDVPRKLARGARGQSPGTANGVQRHLKLVARVYAEVVEPLHGPIPQRLEQILVRLFDERARRPPDAWAREVAQGAGG